MRNHLILRFLAVGCLFGLFACAKQDEPVPLSETITNQPSVPVSVTGRYEETAQDLLPNYEYSLSEVHEVDGRQGIAWSDGMYYVSGSSTLSVYDEDWNLVLINENPFSSFEAEVNHIGDIDVYNDELYAGVEYFMDGEAENLQIAVYDAKTLELKRTTMFADESGQNEVSGIAVDPDSSSVWICSWADGESGRYLYRYELNDGRYLGKVHLQPCPQWIQGIAYSDGWIYISADDGTADLGEADHIYRVKVNTDRTTMNVMLERTLDDVTMQGEIEGLCIDRSANQMLISYNRGSQIVLGMVKGFYEGYDHEIHEIFLYDRTQKEDEHVAE